MSIYEQWNLLAEAERPDNELREFWTAYYAQEKQAYDKILNEKKKKLTGTVKEISEYLELEPAIFVGFLEGINTSLKKEYDAFEDLAEDVKLDLTIDMNKLYYNMLKNKADWLYTLPGWDNILSVEERKEITKEFRASGVIVNENKTGRNDPCPCGSGKKYKKCCGKEC